MKYNNTPDEERRCVLDGLASLGKLCATVSPPHDISRGQLLRRLPYSVKSKKGFVDQVLGELAEAGAIKIYKSWAGGPCKRMVLIHVCTGLGMLDFLRASPLGWPEAALRYAASLGYR